MPKLDKSMLKRLIVTIAIFYIALISLPIATVKAGNLTAMSDTMSRLQATTASNHSISFTMTAGTSVIESETITVTFPAAFDTSTIDCGDIDLLDDAAEENLQNEAGGCTADADEWGAVFAADVLTLTAPSGAATYIAGSSVVVIEIGTNTAEEGVGDEQIVNSGDGSQTISIGGNFGDTGSFAVPIMTGDQVTVSATVDPSITSVLSASTCLLGTLSSANIQTCTYTNTVNTNAGTGFTSTILDDGNLRDGGNDINDAGGDNDVDAGSEGYGASTSDAGNTIVQYTACADPEPTPLEASALTTGAQSYSTAAGPVSADVTTVCHGASITATTPAGIFQHITTHITTGI